MFWAIWNETSEDRYYYGGDAPIGTPDSPITNERDQISRQFTEFLIGPPYCDEDGTNQAPGEQPWTVQQLGVQIEHCKDHRFMMAQVIINGFVNYERTADPKTGLTWYYADQPESLMAAAYRYDLINLAGSLGVGDYDLWGNSRMCTSAGYFDDWPKQLKARGTDEWSTFSTYADLIDKRNLVDFQAVGDEQHPGCGYNDECLKSFPTQAQIDALSVPWLAEYYECFSTIPLESIPDYDPFRPYIIHFQQAAPRIMTQIDAAIHDFYLRKPDPTKGGYRPTDCPTIKTRLLLFDRILTYLYSIFALFELDELKQRAPGGTRSVA